MVAVVASFLAGNNSLPSIAFIKVDFPLDIVATTAISKSFEVAIKK